MSERVSFDLCSFALPDGLELEIAHWRDLLELGTQADYSYFRYRFQDGDEICLCRLYLHEMAPSLPSAFTPEVLKTLPLSSIQKRAYMTLRLLGYSSIKLDAGDRGYAEVADEDVGISQHNLMDWGRQMDAAFHANPEHFYGR